MEKGLGFVPTPNMINEEDLRRDFNEFSRKMRCKWYFRNEPSNEFSEIPAFRPKSNWKPPAGHPYVELFLSKMEHELFSFLPGKPQTSLKNLKEDRSIGLTVMSNCGTPTEKVSEFLDHHLQPVMKSGKS